MKKKKLSFGEKNTRDAKNLGMAFKVPKNYHVKYADHPKNYHPNNHHPKNYHPNIPTTTTTLNTTTTPNNHHPQHHRHSHICTPRSGV
jgi:hypothetical protein